MKKAIVIFTALLCLIINLSSCTPEVITSDQDTTYATGDEIDDPVDPDEGD